MQIQRINNELNIKLSNISNINIEYLQKFLDYLRFIEIADKSQATEEQILELSNDINTDWWQKNKSQFIQ